MFPSAQIGYASSASSNYSIKQMSHYFTIYFQAITLFVFTSDTMVIYANIIVLLFLLRIPVLDKTIFHFHYSSHKKPTVTLF